VNVRTSPVPELVIVTDAPGMTAPFESVTVPLIEPVPSCDWARTAEAIANRQKTQFKMMIALRIPECPPQIVVYFSSSRPLKLPRGGFSKFPLVGFQSLATKKLFMGIAASVDQKCKVAVSSVSITC